MPAAGRALLAVILVATMALTTGCEQEKEPTPAAAKPEQPAESGKRAISASALRQAQAATIRAATPIVNRTEDRYLKGPKRIKAKCKATGQRITCNATAYAKPQAIYDSPSAPYSVAIADEDWAVPVAAGGKLGKPRIKGAYKISGFLEADNVANCSGGESLNC